MRVRHRHIIYVQGYDPRGLAQYYRMFRTELRKFGALYGLSASVGRPQGAPDGETGSWTIETRAEDWTTRTRYDFLRWEDLIQRDLAAPIWQTVFHATGLFWRAVFTGTLGRFWKANWRFAAFVIYPHFVFLIEVLGSLGLAVGLSLGLRAGLAIDLGQRLGVADIPAWAFWIVGGLAFAGILSAMLKWTERWTYLLYLLSDGIWTWEFSHGRRPEWDGRIDRFAQQLIEVVRRNEAEEIVLVGHSSGSFLSIEILARALQLDRALGSYGPRVVLLTVGGNLPIVGFHAVSQAFRDDLRMLAMETSIDWIDCQSRKDVMNFYPFDPIAGHGIELGAARRNPHIVPVRFREIIRPENYRLFRWKFFRVHFQFVMANELPHAYDFFMIVCGPVPLRDRMGHPEAALAVVVGEPETRLWAWKKLETGSNRPELLPFSIADTLSPASPPAEAQGG